MTDGLEAARRSEVAKSFRYARAFYDEAEAAGPAEFERNRQAIIDVIALAYRDGTGAAQKPDDALQVAALGSALERVVASYLDVTVRDPNRAFQMYRIAKNALETGTYVQSEEAESA